MFVEIKKETKIELYFCFIACSKCNSIIIWQTKWPRKDTFLSKHFLFKNNNILLCSERERGDREKEEEEREKVQKRKPDFLEMREERWGWQVHLETLFSMFLVHHLWMSTSSLWRSKVHQKRERERDHGSNVKERKNLDLRERNQFQLLHKLVPISVSYPLFVSTPSLFPLFKNKTRKKDKGLANKRLSSGCDQCEVWATRKHKETCFSKAFWITWIWRCEPRLSPKQKHSTPGCKIFHLETKSSIICWKTTSLIYPDLVKKRREGSWADQVRFEVFERSRWTVAVSPSLNLAANTKYVARVIPSAPTKGRKVPQCVPLILDQFWDFLTFLLTNRLIRNLPSWVSRIWHSS